MFEIRSYRIDFETGSLEWIQDHMLPEDVIEYPHSLYTYNPSFWVNVAKQDSVTIYSIAIYISNPDNITLYIK